MSAWPLVQHSIRSVLPFTLQVHGENDLILSNSLDAIANFHHQNSPIDGQVNYALIVVAYGPVPSIPGVNGFKVRNSMGTSWGSAGYFWMKENDKMCGLCSKFVYA